MKKAPVWVKIYLKQRSNFHDNFLKHREIYFITFTNSWVKSYLTSSNWQGAETKYPKTAHNSEHRFSWVTTKMWSPINSHDLKPKQQNLTTKKLKYLPNNTNTTQKSFYTEINAKRKKNKLKRLPFTVFGDIIIYKRRKNKIIYYKYQNAFPVAFQDRFSHLWQIANMICVQQQFLQTPGIAQNFFGHICQRRVTFIHKFDLSITPFEYWNALKHCELFLLCKFKLDKSLYFNYFSFLNFTYFGFLLFHLFGTFKI